MYKVIKIQCGQSPNCGSVVSRPDGKYNSREVQTLLGGVNKLDFLDTAFTRNPPAVDSAATKLEFDYYSVDLESLRSVPFDWNSVGRLNWVNLYNKLLSNPAEIYRLLFTLKLIPSTRNCRRCGSSDCILAWKRCGSKAVLGFRCRRCPRRENRRVRISVLSGTFFEKTKISLGRILGMAYWLIYGDGGYHQIIRECSAERNDINNSTLAKFINAFKEVCCRKVYDTTYIGGPCSTVEVSEYIKLCSRNNDQKENINIVIGVCRESGDLFIVENEKRNAQNFLSLIIQYVQPHTTIVTNCSKFFEELTEEKWQSMTAGTNLNFMEPKTSTDMQNVNGTYGQLKRSLFSKPSGGCWKKLGLDLGFYLWKKKYSKMDVNLYKLFLHHLADVFGFVNESET